MMFDRIMKWVMIGFFAVITTLALVGILVREVL